MQGLINRAIQCFISVTYGEITWLKIVEKAGDGIANFEAFLDYPVSTTFGLVDAIEAQIALPRSVFLEDLGTFLVTSKTTSAVRRLLRFGGLTYEEFVLSLDELPERLSLALPEIRLPAIEVDLVSPKRYEVKVADGIDGFSYVVVGVLRALADDYGSLAFIEHASKAGSSMITVVLAESDFAVGNHFDFAQVAHAAG